MTRPDMSAALFEQQLDSSPLWRVSRWLLFATLLVPLAVFPGFFFPYVTVRAVYFRVLVEVVTAILLYLVLRREVVLNFRDDLVFWSLLALVGTNTLAAVFGVAPIRSLFGDHERMGGVWFWVHLVAFYFALRTFLRPEDWWRFFRLAVAIAAAIAVFGLLRYKFRSIPLAIGGIDSGVTIGNSGLLGVFLLAAVAMSALLAARARAHGRWLYVPIILILVAGLVFSGNRSSTLGLLIGSGVTLVAYILWTNSVRRGLVVAAIALFAVAAALPFVARTRWVSPVASRLPAVHKLGGGVDSARIIQWRAAVDGIRDRPLLGFGPENYQIVWSRFYHPEMYRFLGDSRWDRAHNAYLDAFATSGLFGFLALLAVGMAMAWSAVTGAKARRVEGASGGEIAIEAIALGFFAAYAVFLVFWFFDLNSTMLWIAIAAFVEARRAGRPMIRFGALRRRRWQTSLVLAAGGVVFVSVIYVHGFETLRMAHTLDRVRSPRGRPPEQVLRDFESVFASPAPVTQHVFLMYANHLASFRSQFAEIQSDAVRSALFDRAFILAVEEFERQAKQDPLNERITAQHARVLILGAYYYGNSALYNSALVRLRRAVELAPRRAPAHLALGMAYLNFRRPKEALASFERAYALYPPLGQTQAFLGMARAALGDYREAERWLTGALHAGFVPNRATVTRVVTELAEAGDPVAGAELARLYVHKQSGVTFTWSNSAEEIQSADLAMADLAAELFARGGRPAAAAALRAASAARKSASSVLCVRTLPLERLAAEALRRSPDMLAACR